MSNEFKNSGDDAYAVRESPGAEQPTWKRQTRRCYYCGAPAVRFVAEDVATCGGHLGKKKP